MNKNEFDYQFRLLDFSVYNKSDNDSASIGDSDSDDNQNIDKFEIQMFGINEKGETCSIYVENYRPFFFIRVGNSWTERTKRLFFEEIKKKVGKKMAPQIVSMDLVDKKKLYGFDSGKMQKFVEIKFENTLCMNRVKYLYYKKSFTGGDSFLTTFKFNGYETELYEAQIPPLLRFFHIRNISPSGWIGFKKSEIEIVGYESGDDDDESYETNTTCNYEFIINWNYIYPVNDKETQVPYKICSFDIEASSSHGDFPIPIKNYKKLAANIVEYFRDYNIEMNDSNLSNELEDIIMNAFGFSSSMKELDCIDIVYPKNKEKINQETIEKKMKRWLKNKIGSLKRKNQTDDEEKDNIFASFQYEEEEEEEKQNNGGFGFGWNKKKPKTSNAEINKLNVFEVLQSNVLDYDDKLNAITDSFNSFPPLEGDKVTFIGSTFLKYGSKEPYLNHCVVLDTCDEIPDIKNTFIETCKTEKEVLLKWRDIIVKEDPDIIIGYNIFGFDYDFMYQRARENNCTKSFLKLSRNRDDICGKLDDNGKVKNIETSKIVIASGEHDLKFIKMGGRLQVDLYNYFRRDFNLPSYKLDYVSSQFIGDSVKKIEHDETNNSTTIITKNMMGLDVGSFIHFEETSHSSELYKDGKKFKISSINKDEKSFTISSIENVDMNKSVRWGLAKDDVTPQDIFRLTNGTSSDRAIVAKYCIQDCNLVHHLMNKIDVITGFVEMSKICSVPLDFLVMRGQGIKLTSFIAKKCMEKNTLMPVIQKQYNDTGYEGAIVLPPKCDLYLDNPVACVDYASLYPSSMISENLSHDSKVWTKEYDLNDKLIKTAGEMDASGNYIYDNLKDYQYVDITYDVYDYFEGKTQASAKEKRKIGYKICRWAQFPNGQKGIMPSILEELLAARKATRKLIPLQQDDFMKNVLDKRQLSYKITANSLYGQCGAKTSTFYEKDVAASTTATGRLLLTYAKRVVEEVYGNRVCNTTKYGEVLSKAEYIYGDTDSVFFTFNLEDIKTGEPIRGKKALEITIELAKEMGEVASKFLKNPHDLEYEKTFMPFCLLSKKRYVGMLYQEDVDKCYQNSMGIVLKRRDNAPIVKDIYGGIIDILMKEQNIGNAIEFLKSSLQNMIEEKIPIEKLIITKSLRSNYKNPKQIAHKVLADRIGKRDPGNKPANGDRIPFAYIKNSKKNALQGDKIELPNYIQENKLQLDYAHYITNQIMKPIQQLLALVLEDIPDFKRNGSKRTKMKKQICEWKRQLKGNDLNEMQFEKKQEDYRSKEVKSLLFDKYINKTLIEKNSIHSYFQTLL